MKAKRNNDKQNGAINILSNINYSIDFTMRTMQGLATASILKDTAE